MTNRLEQIQRLLWVDWDPIGVNGHGPNDEYDGYAFRISEMLNEGKGLAEICDFLRWAAIENMGLSDAGNVDLIARRIVEISGSKP